MHMHIKWGRGEQGHRGEGDAAERGRVVQVELQRAGEIRDLQMRVCAARAVNEGLACPCTCTCALCEHIMNGGLMFMSILYMDMGMYRDMDTDIDMEIDIFAGLDMGIYIEIDTDIRH